MIYLDLEGTVIDDIDNQNIIDNNIDAIRSLVELFGNKVKIFSNCFMTKKDTMKFWDSPTLKTKLETHFGIEIIEVVPVGDAWHYAEALNTVPNKTSLFIAYFKKLTDDKFAVLVDDTVKMSANIEQGPNNTLRYFYTLRGINEYGYDAGQTALIERIKCDLQSA